VGNTQASGRWSGREGYAQGQGLRFESHRPQSTRFYVKKSATCDFPIIKIFFFLFSKINFVFSVKTFLKAVHVTELPVEIHFYRRFLVTACRIGPFILASSTGGVEKCQ